MAKIIDRNDMLDRYVRKGGNRDAGDAQLSNILRSHGGENLVHALAYNGYATEGQARRYVTQNDLQ